MGYDGQYGRDGGDRERGRRRRDRSRSRSRDRGDRRRRDRSKERSRANSGGGGGGGGGGGNVDDHDRRGPAPAPARAENGGVGSVEVEVIRQKSEIDDLTKDQRTVFVSQLVMKATEKQIRKFFEKVGRVKDVIMIRDKYTNRHKGYAYVEMADLESVPMVLMLNGTVADFQRFPILVKASEAEKNFLAKQEATAAQQEQAEVTRRANAPRNKLLVGNLHPNITESDLRTVLAPFGEVASVEMAGVAAGSAIVAFLHADDAQKASSRIAGIELGADKPITVEFYDDPGAAGGGSGAATGDWTLDANPSHGVLNAGNRAGLMASLGARAGLEAPAPAAPPPPRAPPPLVGPATRAFVVSNMFDPATETEANWRADIHEDVSAECGKYGGVRHVHVDPTNPRGLVHVLFEESRAADQAASALHGRWFAGRAITCDYVDPRSHEDQFAAEL